MGIWTSSISLHTVKYQVPRDHWEHSMLSEFRSFIYSQALIVQDGHLASLSGFLDHTHTHGRTPLDEWSARRRGLYLHRTTQHTNIHAPSMIRTRDPSNQAAADLRLRPCGHWDRHALSICTYKITGNRYELRSVIVERTSTQDTRQIIWC
jgi:hypothetical protein